MKNDLIRNDIFNCPEGIFLENGQNNNLSGNQLQGVMNGIIVQASSQNEIGENIIIRSLLGIKLDRSPNNRLQSNELSEDDNGILITSSMQTDLAGNIVQCKDVGLNLVSSTKCNITDNIARNCRQGIRLIDCSHNRIFLNNLSKCQEGLYLDEGVYPQESSNNEIYLNSFSGNGQDVYSFISSNSWSSNTALQYQYHSKAFHSRLGNYWNNGRMRDDNGDGISDVAHSIGSDEDGYPLMGPPLQFKLEPPVEV